VTLKWTDGTPTASSSTTYYPRAGGAAGRGFEFTVEATTEKRTLNSYVDREYNVPLVFDLSFDDGSAPARQMTRGLNNSLVSINYRAGGTTKLRVKITTLDASNGSACLRGASLQSGWTTPLVAAPAQPTQLNSRAIFSTEVLVSWNDTSTTESGFVLERAPDVNGLADTWVQIATPATDATSFLDNGLVANTPYWYRILSTNAAGSSAYSTPTNATTLSALTPLEQWKLANGFPSDAPADSDPNNNDVPLLIKYALGLDLNSTSVNGLPTASLVPLGTEEYLTLTVNRSPLANDVILIVEVSGDLQSWHSDSAHTTVLDDTSTLLKVRDNTPISGAGKRFIRLKAMQ
jgi:hypothetical protein